MKRQPEHINDMSVLVRLESKLITNPEPIHDFASISVGDVESVIVEGKRTIVSKYKLLTQYDF